MRQGIIKQERGSVTIEFAVLLPLLIAILGIIFNFGIVLYDKLIIQNASQVAAQVYAASELTPETVNNIVYAYLQPVIGIDADYVTINLTEDDVNNYVIAEVYYDKYLPLPNILKVIDKNVEELPYVTVYGRAIYYIERKYY